MELFVTVVHVAVCLFMILVVLVQGGNQGGVGAAFGGGNSQGVFGASGATSFLGKLTYGAASVFMVTSISLVILQGAGGDVGLSRKLKLENQTKTEKLKENSPEDQQGKVEKAVPNETETMKPSEGGATQE